MRHAQTKSDWPISSKDNEFWIVFTYYGIEDILVMWYGQYSYINVASSKACSIWS